MKAKPPGKNKLWHPAFLQAMQQELFDYRGLLEFKYEHELVAGPLRIDLLVIKKPKRLRIDKNIARIFRKDNLIEYKSPMASLAVKDFLKMCAYANVYAANTPNVSLEDMTLTFVGNKYPKKLLGYLAKTRGYRAEEASQGIYHVTGDYLPIQIIETKRLPENENLWLQSLRADLETRKASAILELGARRSGLSSLAAYFDILSRANPETFLEAYTMATKTRKKTFEEVFPQWVEIIGKEREERGREEGLAMGEARVLGLLRQGHSLEEIERLLAQGR